MTGRRQFLAGGAASLALMATGIGAAGSSRTSLTPLTRWATGNTSLVPATLLAGHIYFGGDRSIGAIDLAATTPVWRHDIAPPCQFRPRLADGIMLAGGGSFLSAWAAADGALLWRATPRAHFGVPLIHNGHVYCGDGNRLTATELRTGKPIWTFDAIPGTDIAYAPAASADTIFIGPGDGHLYALDAANGKLRWSVDRARDWQYLRQLYVSGDILVAGTYQEKLLGLSVADGGERWAVNGGNFINSQHVTGGTAYFWSPTGWVYAVNTESGDIRWRHRTTDYSNAPNNWGPLVAELATSGNRLFALDLANTLHVLDRDTGDEAARFAVPANPAPFVLPLSEDRVILGTPAGTLTIFRLS